MTVIHFQIFVNYDVFVDDDDHDDSNINNNNNNKDAEEQDSNNDNNNNNTISDCWGALLLQVDKVDSCSSDEYIR